MKKWELSLVCLMVAGMCTLVTQAADYNQTEDLGARCSGDTVNATATPPGTVLTGGVNNPGGFTWSGGPASFDGTIPRTFSGSHAGKFSGTYRPDGQGSGGEPPINTWEMDTAAMVVSVEIEKFDRVAPTKTKQLSITTKPSPLPAGYSISLACEPDTGSLGSATVIPASITKSGKVTITGKDQSWGASGAAPNNVKLRARLGSRVLAEEEFTVCSHPHAFSTTRITDVVGITYIYLSVLNSWKSDSGTLSHMDKAQRSEVIQEVKRDNPPFTQGGGASSGYIPADSGSTIDRHGIVRSSIKPGPAGVRIVNQLFIYKCERCGDSGKVCENSGFEIKHEVSSINNSWIHTCTKNGASVTAGGVSASAGSGTATSDQHPLK